MARTSKPRPSNGKPRSAQRRAAPTDLPTSIGVADDMKDVQVQEELGDPDNLLASFAEAASIARTDPAVIAKAEYMAFNDMYDVLTARANGCGLPPTQIRKVGNTWMICYLKQDCSYGNCRPYNVPQD